MPWDAFLDERRQLEGIGARQGRARQNSAPGLCFINCAQVQRAACSACNREARSAVWLITKKLAVVVDFMLNYLSKKTTKTAKTLPQPQSQQRDWRLPLSCLLSAAAHPSLQSLHLPHSPAPSAVPSCNCRRRFMAAIWIFMNFWMQICFDIYFSSSSSSSWSWRLIGSCSRSLVTN